MILLIQKIRPARRAHQIVHARPGVRPVVPGARPAMCVGRIGVRQLVAPLPGGAAIFRGKDACGGTADPQLCGVVRCCHARMQHQPRGTGLPASAVRMRVDPGNPAERGPPVRAAIQLSRFGPDIQRIPAKSQRPHGARLALERRIRGGLPADLGGKTGVAGQPVVELPVGKPSQVPLAAAVVGPLEPGPVPLSSAAGPDRAVFRIGDHMIDRHPSQNGPSACQSGRSAAPVNRKVPFVVPNSSVTCGIVFPMDRTADLPDHPPADFVGQGPFPFPSCRIPPIDPHRVAHPWRAADVSDGDCLWLVRSLI